MNRNPDFFAEVIQAVHMRSRGDETPNEVDRQYRFAEHQLLTSWRGVPADERLSAWVRRAREVLAAAGLAEDGDIYIGTALSAAPVDADGTWPPRSVRDVIETVISDALDQGFSMGVRNTRRVTWRGEFEGGAQERDLSQKYDAFAAAIAGGWGRTAAVLRGLAKAYSAEARRADTSADLWRDLEV